MKYLRDIRRDWLAIALLALLTCLFMWRVVVLGQVLLPLDEVFAVEPWRSESSVKLQTPSWNPVITDAIWGYYPALVSGKASWQAGSVFWDPNVMAGVPSLARGEIPAGPIYLLLSMLMPVAVALSWTAVVHLFLGCLFTYLFLRELGTRSFGALVGALAFGFNGYLIGWLSLPTCTDTMVWLPLLFWSVERALCRQDWRWALVGGLGFTAQVASGNIVWPFYGAITLGLYVLYRSALIWLAEKNLRASLRPLLYGCLALAVGTALAAPFLLSTVELVWQTRRMEAVGQTSFLSLVNLIRLFVPTISGNSVRGDTYSGPFNYPETNLYFGVLPLFFALASLFSRQRKLAWGFFGLGLVALLAVHNVFPLRMLVSRLYPVFLNTFPGRIFYVVAFCWAVAAGLGADWLVTARPTSLLRALGLVSAALAGGLLLVFWFAKRYGQPVADSATTVTLFPRIVHTDSLLIAFAWLAMGALLLWIWGRLELKPWVFSAIALLLVTADLFVTGIDYNPTFDPKLVFPETASLRVLKELLAKEGEPARVVNINSGTILPGMVPELFGLPAVTGYTSFMPRRYADYADLTGNRAYTHRNQVYFADCCDPLLNALNVKYVYAASETSPNASQALNLADRLGQARIESTVGAAEEPWNIGGVERQVLYEHPPARISYELKLRRPVTLTAAIAVSPLAWGKTGDGVQFEAYVAPAGEGAETLVFSRYIDPKHNFADRGWLPVEISLARYTGQNVTLHLVTKPGPMGDVSFDWAGWAEPRVENYFPSALQLVYDGPNKIYKNIAALPRAWIVYRVTQVSAGDEVAVQKRLRAVDFDPAVEAVVEGRLASDLGSALATDKVKVTSYAPQRAEITAELREPGLLVLSDNMYPGWKAYVDGVERPILVANLIMRGVPLEAGKHTILFVYRPVAFVLGSWIAGAALLFIVIALIWFRVRSRNHASVLRVRSSSRLGDPADSFGSES